MGDPTVFMVTVELKLWYWCWVELELELVLVGLTGVLEGIGGEAREGGFEATILVFDGLALGPAADRWTEPLAGQIASICQTGVRVSFSWHCWLAGWLFPWVAVCCGAQEFARHGISLTAARL